MIEEEVVETVKVEEPPVIEKEEIVKEEPIKVDLDSVRKKAYGSIDNLLEEALEEVKKMKTLFAIECSGSVFKKDLYH